MAHGETVTCGECGTEFYAVYADLGHFRRPEDTPAVVESIEPPAGLTAVDVDGLGIVACPSCRHESRVLDNVGSD